MPTTKELREISPERLYPLKAFQEASGIAPTRMREARLQGVHLTTVDVGRRKYVRGIDGIAYIETLAKLASGELVLGPVNGRRA